jgi:hypothetical protein
MREAVNAARLREFMRQLGTISAAEGRIYLTGGATAVLHQWRDTTLDVDIKIIPDDGRVLRVVPRLKESLNINVELASPTDFIPEVPGWQERSPFISREGALSFHHFDFYSQALAKIERGHRKDIADVRSMLTAGFIAAEEVLRLFEQIEPELYRYPAIEPAEFRKAVLEMLQLQ